jgi:hypothetical protein
MVRPKRLWETAAVIFSIVNVVGGIIAVIDGEMMHAAAHAILFAGTFIVWRGVTEKPIQQDVANAPQLDLHLDHLQQSVDAIALEVERIGEAQRFVTKIVQQEAQQQLPDDE